MSWQKLPCDPYMTITIDTQHPRTIKSQLCHDAKSMTMKAEQGYVCIKEGSLFGFCTTQGTSDLPRGQLIPLDRFSKPVLVSISKLHLFYKATVNNMHSVY